MLRTLFSLLVVAGLATSASAATVTVTLNILEDAVGSGNGSFNLTLGASAGDNFGVAGYGVPLFGGILTLDHNSPNTLFATTPGSGPAGFSFVRSADGALLVGAGQDTTSASNLNLVRGFGQESSSFAAKGVTAVSPAEQGEWDVPLEIATGTWAGVLPTIVMTDLALGVNVFSESSGIATEAATLDTVINLPGVELDPAGSIVGDGSFGTVVRGTLAQRMFSIQSTGDADLTLGDPSISGPFSIVGTLPTTLASGESANFEISFNTGSQAIGDFAGLFSIDTNAGLLSTDLSGRVVPEPSTFALLGLALVGMVGYARRRS